MSDQPSSPAAALPLAVNWQYVRDLSFESPRAPQVFVQQAPAPQVSIQVRVDARPVGENTFEVVLVVEAKAVSGEDPVFLVELEYAGIFTAAPMAPDALTPLLMIEGPRLLFPFARELIASTTRSAGFPPLLINPIDFADLYRQQLRQRQNAPAEGAAAPTTGTA
jgi:preprotein translocase subunit SecB